MTSPPFVRLPPLYALQCFECVSRHQSVKLAAAELNVTSAAVSQQLRKLEDVLKIPLFSKGQRGMVLTEEGKKYSFGIGTAFRQIEEATKRLSSPNSRPVITISCTPGFAMQWLLPRLPRFHEQDTGCDVRISTNSHLVDFSRDDVDFAVRHGLGKYDGLESELLLDDQLLPICSPQLLQPKTYLTSPDDLRGYTLLHDEHRDDWKLWLKATRADIGIGNGGLLFVDSNGAIEAAKSGHGIALARKSLVLNDINNGRLITPFKVGIKTLIAYYLVYPAETILGKDAKQFREWILQEIRKDQHI